VEVGRLQHSNERYARVEPSDELGLSRVYLTPALGLNTQPQVMMTMNAPVGGAMQLTRESMPTSPSVTVLKRLQRSMNLTKAATLWHTREQSGESNTYAGYTNTYVVTVVTLHTTSL